MDAVIGVTTFALFIVSYYFVKEHKKLSEEDEIRELVAWCLYGYSEKAKNTKDLLGYVRYYQKESNIPHAYCIQENEEWDYVNKILDYYQMELQQHFFFDQLHLPKTRLALLGKEYFMYSLQLFLEKYQCSSYFFEYDMHKETLSKKNYGIWGSELYDAVYSITDFAVAYNKLYYVSYVYCKENQKIDPKNEVFNDEKTIEDIITQKQISISQL